MIPYYVYVVGFDEHPSYLKVGVTDQPSKRLMRLQTGNPFQLLFRYLVRCDDEQEARSIERAAHVTLKKLRTVGEWFAVDPETAISSVRSAADDLGYSLVEQQDVPTDRPWITDETPAQDVDGGILTGKQIRQARKLLGWNQIELSRHAGTSKKAAAALERGDRIPKPDTVRRMREAFEKAGIVFQSDGIATLED